MSKNPTGVHFDEDSLENNSISSGHLVPPGGGQTEMIQASLIQML